MWFPGHKVTQEASLSWQGNHRCGSGPISASQAADTTSPNPGTLLSRPSSRRHRAAMARDLLIQPGDRVIGQLDLVPVHAAQHGVVLGEPGGQRHRQVGLLAR